MVLNMDRTGRHGLRDTRWDPVLRGRHGLRDSLGPHIWFIKRKSGLRYSLVKVGLKGLYRELAPVYVLSDFIGCVSALNCLFDVICMKFMTMLYFSLQDVLALDSYRDYG